MATPTDTCGSTCIWVRDDLFHFGILSVPPASRLEISKLKKLSAYIKLKNLFPTLTLTAWLQVSKKLLMDRGLALIYFRLFDTIQGKNWLKDGLKGLDAEFENIRSGKKDVQDTFRVPTFQFLLFLYIQRGLRSAARGRENQKNGGQTHVEAQLRTNATKIQKSIREQLHYQFVHNNIDDLISVLHHGYQATEEISMSIVMALECLFCCALNPLRSAVTITFLQVITECSEVARRVGYDAGRWIVRRTKFVKWLREVLKYNPWGLSTSFYCNPKIFPPTGIVRADNTVASENRIVFNRKNPPFGWFSISKVWNQVYFTGQIPNFSNLSLHRCANSFIYAPGVFDSVLIDKCCSCVIYLGAAAKILKIRECCDVTVHGVARIVILNNLQHCKVCVITPSPPVISGSRNESIELGAFSDNYSLLGTHMEQAGIMAELNNWKSPFFACAESMTAVTFTSFNERHPYPFVFNGYDINDTSYAVLSQHMEVALAEMITTFSGKDLGDESEDVPSAVFTAWKCWLEKTENWGEIQGLLNLEVKWNACVNHAKHRSESTPRCQSVEVLLEYLDIQLNH